MSVRMIRLRAMISAAAVVACVAAFMAASTEEAKASFPGKNGRIAFTLFPEVGDSEIYKVFPRRLWPKAGHLQLHR